MKVSVVAVLVLAALVTACPRGVTVTPAVALPDTTGPRPVVVAEHQQSGTTALLQAVSAADARTLWASGRLGTYTRTTDGGLTWRAGVVPGADSLEFRDVEAVSADTAYLLAAGPGERSRIYKTVDGGATWALQFVNREPAAFFDCMAFWDAERGLAMSDAVRGRLIVLVTRDGGARWTPVPDSALPPALPGEGAFAASGTCVVARAARYAWIGTGNASPARVLRTSDGARSWTASPVPLVSGPSAGIATLAFRDTVQGVAMGGRIGAPGARGADAARTVDGGRSWVGMARPPFPGAVYGAAYGPEGSPPPLVAVGPGGAALTQNDGASWTPLDTLAYWSVTFAAPDRAWAVGPGGRITRFVIAR